MTFQLSLSISNESIVSKEPFFESSYCFFCSINFELSTSTFFVGEWITVLGRSAYIDESTRRGYLAMYYLRHYFSLTSRVNGALVNYLNFLLWPLFTNHMDVSNS